MSRTGTLDPIETCTFHLRKWKPFTPPTSDTSTPKPTHSGSGPYSKRPCRSDRTTSSFSIESILDMSKLTLFDSHKRWFARKRRRRYGSRSVSGRSCTSDTRMCRSVNGGTCSDLPMATDSSGELFGDGNWASDVSEKCSRKEREDCGSVCGNDRGNGEGGGLGNEEGGGYGSEPGYRGDAEIGYGDEFDEEDDESKGLFWGDEFRAGSGSQLEMVGENSMQKTHHRGRRKKQDVRMVDAPR